MPVDHGNTMKCTIPAKIFQKSTASFDEWDARKFTLFLQFVILFTKTAYFDSKNVIFMCLIFNELNIVFPRFV